jgi:hypothetical protein
VIGHLLVLGVGYGASLFFPHDRAKDDCTIWGWLKTRKQISGLGDQKEETKGLTP